MEGLRDDYFVIQKFIERLENQEGKIKQVIEKVTQNVQVTDKNEQEFKRLLEEGGADLTPLGRDYILGLRNFICEAKKENDEIESMIRKIK